MSTARAKFVLFLCLLFAPSLACAYSLEFGVGVEGVKTAYKNYDTEWTFVPAVDFDSDYIYVRDYGVGFKFINLKNDEDGYPFFTASIYTAYDDFNFNPSRASDTQMQKLSHRWDGYFAGIRLLGVTSLGAFEATAAHDIFGHSDGWYGALSYYLDFNADVVEFFPYLGIDWADRKYNAYFYGINQKESLASGLSTYHPKASVAPFVGLAMVVPLYKKWELVGNFKASYVADTIRSSPMVGRSGIYTMDVMLSYAFE